MNTCSTCQYFDESSCHRYPPVVVAYVEAAKGQATYTNTETEFPQVLPTEWCGEWKSKPITEEDAKKMITEWTNKLSCNHPS